MTEKNLKLGVQKLQNINDLKLFKKQLETSNSGVLKFDNAELPIARGSDLYCILIDYLTKKISALEEDFSTFDLMLGIEDGEH